jgi:hypothetical protein
MQDLYVNGEHVRELENAPELYSDAAEYWNMFIDLCNSRASGFSIGYIPFHQVTNWLDENMVFSLEERGLYRRLVAVIDNVFVEKKSKPAKSDNTPGPEINK